MIWGSCDKANVLVQAKNSLTMVDSLGLVAAPFVCRASGLGGQEDFCALRFNWVSKNDLPCKHCLETLSGFLGLSMTNTDRLCFSVMIHCWWTKCLNFY